MSESDIELPPLEERPLVTFALFAYNQEKYIREAVEGAFLQTYEPLEIILSDDCSTDRTFEIMQEMEAEYKGPHTIRLNQNEINLGISRHVRKIHEISGGQIIIHAAGDDISTSERTSAIVNEFQTESDDILLLISNGIKINMNGDEIEILSRNGNDKRIYKPSSPLIFNLPGVNGCTLSIKKKLVDLFPPPHESIIAEDVVLIRRAFLVGAVVFIPDVLVKYRIGSGVTTQRLSIRGKAERYLVALSDQILRFRQFEQDAKNIGKDVDDLSNKIIIRESNIIQLKRDSVEYRSITSLLYLFPHISIKEWLWLIKIVLGAKLNDMSEKYFK